MRIPGGDLAPARRRRYGGSYGRRRRRRIRLFLAVLLVVVGAGAAYLLRKDDTGVPSRVAQQPSPQASCPSATPTPAAVRAVVLPRPQQVHLALLNGTARNGLAKAIGDQLAARGFVVTAQGNAPSALAGPSQVAFGRGAQPAALLVSRWVLGSRTVTGPRVPPGTVQVILGSGFARLATPAEVAAASRTPATSAPAATRPGCPS